MKKHQQILKFVVLRETNLLLRHEPRSAETEIMSPDGNIYGSFCTIFHVTDEHVDQCGRGQFDGDLFLYERLGGWGGAEFLEAL